MLGKGIFRLSTLTLRQLKMKKFMSKKLDPVDYCLWQGEVIQHGSKPRNFILDFGLTEVVQNLVPTYQIK